MGRPKKNEEDKKTCLVLYRCTKEEKLMLKNLVEKLGVSQADALRILVREANNIIRDRA